MSVPHIPSRKGSTAGGVPASTVGQTGDPRNRFGWDRLALARRVSALPRPVKWALIGLLVLFLYALPLLELPIISTPDTDFGAVLFTVASYVLVALGDVGPHQVVRALGLEAIRAQRRHQRVGAQPRGDLVGELARLGLGVLGEHHRGIGRHVAMAGIARRLHHDACEVDARGPVILGSDRGTDRVHARQHVGKKVW